MPRIAAIALSQQLVAKVTRARAMLVVAMSRTLARQGVDLSREPVA